MPRNPLISVTVDTIGPKASFPVLVAYLIAMRLLPFGFSQDEEAWQACACYAIRHWRAYKAECATREYRGSARA